MGTLPVTSQICSMLEKPWRKRQEVGTVCSNTQDVAYQVLPQCQWDQMHPWVSGALTLELRGGPEGRVWLFLGSLTFVLHFTFKAFHSASKCSHQEFALNFGGL